MNCRVFDTLNSLPQILKFLRYALCTYRNGSLFFSNHHKWWNGGNRGPLGRGGRSEKEYGCKEKGERRDDTTGNELINGLISIPLI
jgi:hypothetical protein